MKEQRMFGLWPSPIGPRDIASGIRLGEPCWDSDGERLAWVEGRSDRGVIVIREADGSPVPLHTPRTSAGGNPDRPSQAIPDGS